MFRACRCGKVASPALRFVTSGTPKAADFAADATSKRADTGLSESPVAVATRLIVQQCRSALWQNAIQHLTELSEMITPDVVCFTAVIGICSKASAWQQGLLLLRYMSKVEVSPNVVTYNSLLAARSNASWRWALALLSEMEEVKLQPDQVTYNTTLVALRKAGLSRQALRASDKLVKPNGADAYTYCALISACKKTAKWAKALNLVADAMRRFSKLNKFVLSAGIAACARGLQPQHAMRLLHLGHGHGGGPDAISRDAAVTACAATFLWAEALSLIDAAPGVQSLLGAAFATASSSSAPELIAARVTAAAQKRASKELLRRPKDDGTWHDAILERARLLRMLRAYVLVPVLSQLRGGLSSDTNIDVLQQQYAFGGLCKDLALQLGVEYPARRLPSEWMGPEALAAWRRPSRNYGVVLPREPVAQELFVCLDYSIFPRGKRCAQHLHVSYMADRSRT